MSVGAISSGAPAADMMKLLDSAMEMNTDLAKRMVKLAVAEKVQSVSSQALEGIGQNFDCYA